MKRRDGGLTDKERAFVYAYCGEANYNATKAVGLAGYKVKAARQLGSELLSKPDVRAAIDLHLQELRGQSLRSREGRIARLEDLERRAWEVIEAREQEYRLDLGADGEWRKTFERGESVAPGAHTGLMSKTFKVVGAGRNQQLVTEWAVDTALMREIRETSKQVATEVGEWNERRQITGPDEGPIKVEVVESAAERLLALLAEETDAGDAAEDTEKPNG